MNKLKLYLDNCCFNRPFDNQSQLKIYLETQAKLAISRSHAERGNAGSGRSASRAYARRRASRRRSHAPRGNEKKLTCVHRVARWEGGKNFNLITLPYTGAYA
jgi:hypothetical protein